MTKFLNNADIKGYIAQTAVTSYLLKADSTGRLVAAIAGTDYQAPTTALLPSGGTAGQILSKIDGTNYNAQWIDNFAQQIKYDVKLGAALSKGTPVYVSSANGTNIIVSASSNATEATSSKTLGLLETGGALNDIVKVVSDGLLSGLDTSTATIGDPVWLGVNGALIFGLANKPSAPAHLVYIGAVTRVHATNGEIFIKVQNGFELDELHNVALSSVADGQGLFYESATSLWKNKTIASVLGYTPANDSTVVHLAGTETITGVKTFSSVINASTLSLNGGTLAGNNIVSMRSNPTGGQFRIEKSDGSLSAYPFYIGVDGTALAYYYNAAGALKVLLHTNDTSYFGNSLSIGYATYASTSYMLDVNGIARFAGAYVSFNDNGYIRGDATGWLSLQNGINGFRVRNNGNTSDYFTITQSTGAATFSSSVTATSFIKSGGTSAQFLKADGSVDSSTYLTSITSSQVTTALGYTPYNATNPSGYITSSALSSYLPLSGGTLTGNIVLGSGTIGSIPSWMKVITTDATQSGLGAVYNNKAVYLYNNGSAIKLDAYDYGTSTGLNIQIGGNGGKIIASNGQVQFTAYTTATSFSGTAAGYLAFDSSGNVITVGSVAATDNTKLPLAGGTMTGGLVQQAAINAWGTTTQGGTVGGIHLGAASAATNAGPAITFGARDASAGANAQAGIYINSDGNYGTRMYLATTDSYAAGSKTAVSISETGVVNFVRANATVQGNGIWHAGNLTNLNQLTNGPGYITSSATISGAAARISSRDNRTIAPNSDAATELRFGFTSWNNNNTAPWADYIHLRSYSDSSGGADNLITFLKSGIGMRIWQQTWGSATAYSSYVDVLHSGNYSSYALPLSGGQMSGSFAVGNQQGNDNPGGWNKYILIDGTSHGRFRIKASNYTYGNIEVSLWADSSVSPSHGITGSNAVFSFGGSITSLTVGGQTVIHTGNIGSQSVSYATNAGTASNISAYTINQSVGTGNTPTFNGVYLSSTYSHSYPGILQLGNTSYNYLFTNGTWASSITAGILANCSDNWEIAIHDSGHRVVSPIAFYGGASNYILMGRDIGWGTTYVQAASSFRAPIFYDSDDTTYYLDPAGNGTRAGYFNGNIWINPKPESYGEGVTFYMPNQNTWGGLRWYRNGPGGGYSGNWAFGYFGNEANNDIGFHNGTNGWRLDQSFNMTTAGHVMSGNWVYSRGNAGWYNNDYGQGLRQAKANVTYGNVIVHGENYNGWSGYNTNLNYITCFMQNSSGTHGWYQENGAGWTAFYNYGYACWGLGTDATDPSYSLHITKYGGSNTGWIIWSDRRIKENIKTIDNALDKVLALRGVYYNKIDDPTKTRQVGYIAQEVMEVVPELVVYSEELDIYNMNYAPMVGMLTEAIKEQQSQIETLKTQVQTLLTHINNGIQN